MLAMARRRSAAGPYLAGLCTSAGAVRARPVRPAGGGQMCCRCRGQRV